MRRCGLCKMCRFCGRIFVMLVANMVANDPNSHLARSSLACISFPT